MVCSISKAQFARRETSDLASNANTVGRDSRVSGCLSSRLMRELGALVAAIAKRNAGGCYDQEECAHSKKLSHVRNVRIRCLERVGSSFWMVCEKREQLLLLFFELQHRFSVIHAIVCTKVRWDKKNDAGIVLMIAKEFVQEWGSMLPRSVDLFAWSKLQVRWGRCVVCLVLPFFFFINLRLRILV